MLTNVDTCMKSIISLLARSGQVDEICEGIKAYFNAMLGSQLLYKFERLQYSEVQISYSCCCFLIVHVHCMFYPFFNLTVDFGSSSRQADG